VVAGRPACPLHAQPRAARPRAAADINNPSLTDSRSRTGWRPRERRAADCSLLCRLALNLMTMPVPSFISHLSLRDSATRDDLASPFLSPRPAAGPARGTTGGAAGTARESHVAKRPNPEQGEPLLMAGWGSARPRKLRFTFIVGAWPAWRAAWTSLGLALAWACALRGCC